MVMNKKKLYTTSQVIDVLALLLFFPEGEVLLEELDDGLGVTEIVLLELINLVKSILEGLVGKLAGGLVVLHHLVVEDGEVQGQAELDWVAWWEIDGVSLLVSLESILLDLLELVALGVLGDIAVVISNHLDEEGLWLTVALLGEDVGLDHADDLLAVSGQLVLDAGLVLGEVLGELGVLGVLLNGGNGSAGSAFAGDEVLEGHGEKVALVGRDALALGVEHSGEVLNHVLEALGLLGNTGEENVLLNLLHWICRDSKRRVSCLKL